MTQDAAWWEEQHRLKLVLNEVRKLIERSEELSEQRQSTVTEARKDFWDDITVNLANPDDIMETYTSITQQSMMLAGQERSLQHAENTRYRLLRMYNSPYFGRIDFTEKGSYGTEKIYIGIASVLDEQTQTYWVYDWRAPVSSLFYDYSPGPANYETPMGTISGTLDLKRQFMIRGGEIKAMFNTGITIGDEVLQHILGQRTDDHMKSIVATIQKEQNQIIRDDRHRVLIVQGAAGSGKTSVALQRVAYLLYKHRQTLNSIIWCCSVLTPCLTAISQASFLSLAKPICSKRPIRTICSCALARNFKWKMRTSKWKRCFIPMVILEMKYAGAASALNHPKPLSTS